MTRRLPLVLALALACVPFAGGCGPGGGGRIGNFPSEGRTAPTVEVSDDAFAGAVRDLLTSAPRSPERQTRLQGVLARQMHRADALFRKSSSERGLAAVKGALYLARMGDLGPSTLGPKGVPALQAAVRSLSQRGDEGRSRALYEILLRIAPPAQRADVQGHLSALAAWTKDGRALDVESGAAMGMDASSEAQRVALARALLEPSKDALDAATNATVAWFLAAMHPLPSWSRWDRVERARAIQSAASTIIALHLRDGDPRGAVDALDKDDRLRQTAPRHLYAAVAALADKQDGDRWREALDALLPTEEGEDDPIIDRDLLAASLATTAAEAYRADSTALKPALTLAELLQSFGMGEASPAVLVDTCKAHPEELALDQSLFITERALEAATEADDPDAARRTYKAAEPILAIAEASKVALKTSPARVRGTMGEIELREGRLAAARDLLKRATGVADPSPMLLLDLARIEQHDGDLRSASAHLATALKSAGDPAMRGEITLVSSEVMVAQGDADGARKQLAEALKGLHAARNVREPAARARVERAIARIDDRFGLTKQADDALQRALEATPHDKAQLAATLAVMGSRALVRGNLDASRDALRRAVTADLGEDDLVYFALWERAVERQRRATTDGVADRVFASMRGDGTWASSLAAFAIGKLKGEDLIAAAQSPSKKAEATFYVALERRAAGDRAAAEQGFKVVATGAGVDLIEADLARQMITPRAPLSPPAWVAAAP
jgi:tetratricopeptide (TPR) repeat protein